MNGKVWTQEVPEPLFKWEGYRRCCQHSPILVKGSKVPTAGVSVWLDYEGGLIHFLVNVSLV